MNHPLDSLENALKGPSWTHPLGFDAFGQDILLSLPQALYHSLLNAGVAVLLALSVCFAITFASLYSQKVRLWGLFTLNMIQYSPGVIAALIFSYYLGPSRSLLTVAIAIDLIPNLGRLLTLRAYEVSQNDFVLASNALGSGPFHLFRLHILPNLIELSRLKAPSLIAHAILLDSALSLLGIGDTPDQVSLGSWLAQSRYYFVEAPHLPVFSGLSLILCLYFLSKEVKIFAWLNRTF